MTKEQLLAEFKEMLVQSKIFISNYKTKAQLLAEYEEMFVKSKIFERGDGAVQQTSKLLSKVLDKYGAMEYEKEEARWCKQCREQAKEGSIIFMDGECRVHSSAPSNQEN